MQDNEIKTGVQIENMHNVTPPMHRYEIAYVAGGGDQDTVVVNMVGPNGTVPLSRPRQLIRDHYRVVTQNLKDAPRSQINQIMPVVLSNDDGIRPAGNPDECFYCNQKVGHPHKSNCVVLKKRAKVRYSFEFEIDVPWGWNQGNILFHRNDGSWCADNALQELQEASEKQGCLCPVFTCEVLEISEAPPYRKDKDGNILA